MRNLTVVLIGCLGCCLIGLHGCAASSHPIDGMIGKLDFTKGNLVTASPALAQSRGCYQYHP